jgi:hypothetical protein
VIVMAHRLRLVTRGHIDLLRVTSAACPAAAPGRPA